MNCIGSYVVAATIILVAPAASSAQQRLESATERIINAILPDRDDTIRILGFAHPSNCIKCDVAVNALMDSLQSCATRATPTRTGFFVAVSRTSDLRPLRRLYPASTLLIADVRGMLGATVPSGVRSRCIVVYKQRAWVVAAGDPFCRWLQTLR
jgi:hypothetical protein